LRFDRLIILALVVGCLICTPSVRATPTTQPTVQISQNGHTFEDLTLLTSASPAYRYYRYRHSSGHPAFGLAAKTATISLYWDTATDSLSLLFISGGGDSGKGIVTVIGLPRASSLVLSDDPGEFSYSPKKGKLTGNFQYGGSTDGFVLATPDTTTFTADLKLPANRRWTCLNDSRTGLARSWRWPTRKPSASTTNTSAPSTSCSAWSRKAAASAPTC
jgi:hypothetical protein